MTVVRGGVCWTNEKGLGLIIAANFQCDLFFFFSDIRALQGLLAVPGKFLTLCFFKFSGFCQKVLCTTVFKRGSYIESYCY